MRFLPLLLPLVLLPAMSRTLEVGTGRPYGSIQTAAADARPGDTILVRSGMYSGGMFIANLQGRENAWITITTAPGEEVILRGGANAIHFTDPAWIVFSGFIIEGQTGNGINIDDAGSYDTPAHHIIIERCEWRALSATGNNDQLKLSGVDSFVVRNCRFINGAAGGSMVDMVGCHAGLFEDNAFENAGSNSIQAKGGSRDVLIRRNRFINGGQRAINIGGSTGLQFFRPQNATSEASEIRIHANLFVGAVAPLAYVGAVACEAVNNTIIRPDKWVVRILQENTDTRFLQCGDNVFRNNVIFLGNAAANPSFNIGPNTRPETFLISHNLWFNEDNPSWTGPNVPVNEPGRILNQNPLFVNLQAVDGLLQDISPVIAKGMDVTEPVTDFYGKTFARPRSIGAVEAAVPTGVHRVSTVQSSLLRFHPQPANELLHVRYTSQTPGRITFSLFDLTGKKIHTLYEGLIRESGERHYQLRLRGIPPGVYFLVAVHDHDASSARVVLVQ